MNTNLAPLLLPRLRLIDNTSIAKVEKIFYISNMLKGDNITTKVVHGISASDMQRIRDFFQGAVYCWCKNRKREWFSARDFIGGDNYYWEHYPLGVLYFRYINAGKSHDYAFEQAAKDAGRILKCVLSDDDRIFKTMGGFTRKYLWVDD